MENNTVIVPSGFEEIKEIIEEYLTDNGFKNQKIELKDSFIDTDGSFISSVDKPVTGFSSEPVEEVRIKFTMNINSEVKSHVLVFTCSRYACKLYTSFYLSQDSDDVRNTLHLVLEELIRK